MQQDIQPTLNYLEWFGQVRNDTSSLRCDVRVDAAFQTADGSTTINMRAYATAPPYEVPEKTAYSTPCLEPGASAWLFSNDLPINPLDLNSIKGVDLTVSSEQYEGAILHPMTPAISDLTASEGSTSWQVNGTATGIGGAINHLWLEFFETSGSFYEWGAKLDDQPLLPGATWTFKSLGFSPESNALGPFSATLSFSEGQQRAAKLHVGNTSADGVADT